MKDQSNSSTTSSRTNSNSSESSTLFGSHRPYWESLGDDSFDALIRSMERRVDAVLEAKGWYTRY